MFFLVICFQSWHAMRALVLWKHALDQHMTKLSSPVRWSRCTSITLPNKGWIYHKSTINIVLLTAKNLIPVLICFICAGRTLFTEPDTTLKRILSLSVTLSSYTESWTRCNSSFAVSLYAARCLQEMSPLGQEVCTHLHWKHNCRAQTHTSCSVCLAKTLQECRGCGDRCGDSSVVLYTSFWKLLSASITVGCSLCCYQQWNRASSLQSNRRSETEIQFNLDWLIICL